MVRQECAGVQRLQKRLETLVLVDKVRSTFTFPSQAEMLRRDSEDSKEQGVTCCGTGSDFLGEVLLAVCVIELASSYCQPR